MTASRRSHVATFQQNTPEASAFVTVFLVVDLRQLLSSDKPCVKSGQDVLPCCVHVLVCREHYVWWIERQVVELGVPRRMASVEIVGSASFDQCLTHGARLSMPVLLFLVLIQPIGRGTTQAFVFVRNTKYRSETDAAYLEWITRQAMICLSWLVEHHIYRWALSIRS